MTAADTPRLPVFLDLRDKPVLLVGAGRVAHERLAQLIACEARVHVVAREISEDFQMLAATAPDRVRIEVRAATPDDVRDVVLAIAATPDGELHERLGRAADERRIWFNAVDDTRHCRFFFAATLTRGPLRLAIGTEGGFPGLSRALRQFLEAALPDDHLPLLERLVAARRRLRRDPEANHRRKEVLRELVRRLETGYFS